MGTVSENGSVTTLYAECGCDGSTFITKLFVDDEDCDEHSQVVYREIEDDQCDIWLYDGNETNFGFDVTAEVLIFCHSLTLSHSLSMNHIFTLSESLTLSL